MDAAESAIYRIADRLGDLTDFDLLPHDRVLLTIQEFDMIVKGDGLRHIFFYQYPIQEIIEGLRFIGAEKIANLLTEVCRQFPENVEDMDEADIVKIIETDSRVSLLLDTPLPDDLPQLLLEYWRRQFPPAPDLDLSNVHNAAELLASFSMAFGLSDSYGKSLDKFSRAVCNSVRLPSRVNVIGWARVVQLLPQDSQMLLECLHETFATNPESVIAIQWG